MIGYRRSAATSDQLRQRVGSEGRPEASVDELLEAAPRWRALIFFHEDVPLAGGVVEIERRQPNLLLLHVALAAEVMFALGDEGKRVTGTVKLGKVQLVEARLPHRPFTYARYPAAARWRVGAVAPSELAGAGGGAPAAVWSGGRRVTPGPRGRPASSRLLP